MNRLETNVARYALFIHLLSTCSLLTKLRPHMEVRPHNALMSCTRLWVFDWQNLWALSAHTQLLGFSTKHSSLCIFHRFLLALYSTSQSSHLPFLLLYLLIVSPLFFCSFLFLRGRTLSFSCCLASSFLGKRLLSFQAVFWATLKHMFHCLIYCMLSSLKR